LVGRSGCFRIERGGIGRVCSGYDRKICPNWR
jgi:hypothetical protein